MLRHDIRRNPAPTECCSTPGIPLTHSLSDAAAAASWNITLAQEYLGRAKITISPDFIPGGRANKNNMTHVQVVENGQQEVA